MLVELLKVGRHTEKMKISAYAIERLTPYITGNDYPPTRKGKELVALFNSYGARDVYDEYGLPDIGKKYNQRPSRKEYVKARIGDLNDKPELRELLTQVANELNSKEDHFDELNEILNPENYQVVKVENKLSIQGGMVDKRKPVTNTAHFQEVQNKILNALEQAKVSIWVAMAWFTNEVLLNKLVEKYEQGLDVKVAIYDDGINSKHGVDLSQLPHKKIRGSRGGLMHNKFCVIDNQIVITGSYNWTNNAEFRNTENVTIENDPEQASRYSVEFRRITI